MVVKSVVQSVIKPVGVKVVNPFVVFKASPLNIVKSGPCQIWYDGKDEDTFDLNVNKVIRWYDKSGFDRHVANAIDIQRPTWDPATGRITFVAANSTYLQNGAFDAPLIQPNTIFVLAKYTVHNINSILFCGAVVGRRHQIFEDATLDFTLFAGALLSNGSADLNNNIHCTEFNGVVSNYWINGINVAAGNVGTDPLDGITLGTNETIIGQFPDAEICEIFGYNCLLTEAERIRCENYLIRKWGLSY